MKFFKDIFQKNNNIPKSDWQNLVKRLKIKEVPKKTILLKKGEVENYIYYIKKGLVRYYVPQEEGDVTISFSLENDYVSAYDSFITRIPSFSLLSGTG